MGSSPTQGTRDGGGIGRRGGLKIRLTPGEAGYVGSNPTRRMIASRSTRCAPCWYYALLRR